MQIKATLVYNASSRPASEGGKRQTISQRKIKPVSQKHIQTLRLAIYHLCICVNIYIDLCTHPKAILLDFSLLATH